MSLCWRDPNSFAELIDLKRVATIVLVHSGHSFVCTDPHPGSGEGNASCFNSFLFAGVEIILLAFRKEGKPQLRGSEFGQNSIWKG